MRALHWWVPVRCHRLPNCAASRRDLRARRASPGVEQGASRLSALFPDVCREILAVYRRCGLPALDVGLQARRRDLALLGAHGPVWILPSLKGCKSQATCWQSLTSALESPEQSMQRRLMAFRTVPPPSKNSATVRPSSSGIHQALTYLRQHVRCWLSPQAIDPQRARRRWTEAHFMGGAIAAPQAVCAYRLGGHRHNQCRGERFVGLCVDVVAAHHAASPFRAVMRATTQGGFPIRSTLCARRGAAQVGEGALRHQAIKTCARQASAAANLFA